MRLGILGYGEAGQAIAASLAETAIEKNRSLSLIAYDHLYQSKAACDEADVSQAAQLVPSLAELAKQSDIIISVVTADESLNAITALLPYLSSHHHIADGNSVSPGTKRKAEALLQDIGASYSDMAIMAPIHPRGHKTPLLLAGPERGMLADMLDDFGFDYSWEGASVGDASVVKMLRSVLIKGMECLISESVTASQSLGLDTRILQSAGKTLGISDMTGLADYVMERAGTHGRRRAAEMREVTKTLAELGLSHDMSSAIARYQDRIADMNLVAEFDGVLPRDRAKLAEAMREAQKTSQES